MQIVHIIDDDEAIRDALSWLLQSLQINCQSWDSAESFLANYNDKLSGCIILDIRMQGMSGLELFDRLLALDCQLPVIFLTGHGDVPVAVNALKKGAHDFVEKPFNDKELIEKIKIALEKMACSQILQSQINSLSQREKQVMDMIIEGKLNKVIADDLGIAMRTVEVHRAKIFEKMGVRTAVELTKLMAGKK